ncbi:MAG: tetratricopeptide repeat protein, partial [Flavobacteriales bacterium]
MKKNQESQEKRGKMINKKESLFNKGYKNEKNDKEYANDCYQNALYYDKTNYKAWMRLGVMEIDKDKGLAIDHFLKGFFYYYNSNEVNKFHFISDERLNYNKKLKIQLNEFKTIINDLENIENEKAEFLKAILYFQLKNLEKAYNILNLIEPNNINEYLYYLVVGATLILTKRYKEALSSYKNAINKYKNSPKLIYQCGIAKDCLNDLNGAIENITTTINLMNPVIPEVYRTRGLIKKSMQDFKGAIDDYNKAIEIDSENVLMYNNRAEAKVDIKDYKGAVEDYTQALELNPENEDIYV